MHAVVALKFGKAQRVRWKGFALLGRAPVWHGNRGSRGGKDVNAVPTFWDERKRVLLVAPPCPVTRAAALGLRGEGFAVDEAQSAEQAFARVDWAEYDVVIAHLHIGAGGQGKLAEFVNFARKHRPDAVLIEISGCSGEGPSDRSEPSPIQVQIEHFGGSAEAVVQSVCRVIADAIASIENDSSAVSGSGGMQPAQG